jgi:endonuclease/exonuclease/phosphatase (EEP) superfamily protein YafD
MAGKYKMGKTQMAKKKQNKTKRLLMVFSILLGGATLGYFAAFDTSNQAQLAQIIDGELFLAEKCQVLNQSKPLDLDGHLNLLVWNIYKQNRSEWAQELATLAKGKQLILLQEASMSDDFKAWLKRHFWHGFQVNAFKAFNTSMGVLNLSSQLPTRICGYTEMEPWLRLPKSASYALYPLSDGQQLAVINIHSINFTYDTTSYEQQLDTLFSQAQKHQGPMIVAGDFNSWSQARVKALSERLKKLQLNEINYQPDLRTSFYGLPLDHVFARGLRLKKAQTLSTKASDHNPILVEFALESAK